jgi:hypothetical protein
MVRSWCDRVHSRYGVSETAFIQGKELMWPRSFMVRSWCDHVHSWYGVGVIPQSHSTLFLCTLYSGNSEIPLADFFPFCLSSMTSAAINLLCVSVTIRINRVFHSQHSFPLPLRGSRQIHARVCDDIPAACIREPRCTQIVFIPCGDRSQGPLGTAWPQPHPQNCPTLSQSFCLPPTPALSPPTYTAPPPPFIYWNTKCNNLRPLQYSLHPWEKSFLGVFSGSIP